MRFGAGQKLSSERNGRQSACVVYQIIAYRSVRHTLTCARRSRWCFPDLNTPELHTKTRTDRSQRKSSHKMQELVGCRYDMHANADEEGGRLDLRQVAGGDYVRQCRFDRTMEMSRLAALRAIQKQERGSRFVKL